MTGTKGQWVLASGNPGKLEEIRALMGECELEIVSQSTLGIESPAETGETFVENALIKARHACASAGLPAIADDSGLTVDALGGEPGVRSARYAGPGADDQSNIVKLLRALEGTPAGERGAQFHCVMVALGRPQDPVPLICHGQWAGVVAIEASGEGGFGYDPVFFDPELGATAAELPIETKNLVSHRGRALRELVDRLRGRGE